MSDRKSRAEQLLAELDCHVTIDQRADALKAIEAYLVDAYEAGWHDESNTPRRNAEAYASAPERP
jgi:hypothetical protein